MPGQYQVMDFADDSGFSRIKRVAGKLQKSDDNGQTFGSLGFTDPALAMVATDAMMIEQARISALNFGINYWTDIKKPDTALPSTAGSAPAALTTGAWLIDGGGRLSTGTTIDWLGPPMVTKARTRGFAAIFDGFIAAPVAARTAEFGFINLAASQLVVIMTDFATSQTNYLIKGLGGVTTTGIATGVLGACDAQRHIFSLYSDPIKRGKLFGAIDGNEIMSFALDTSVVDQAMMPIMFSTAAGDAALARWCAGVAL